MLRFIPSISIPLPVPGVRGHPQALHTGMFDLISIEGQAAITTIGLGEETKHLSCGRAALFSKFLSMEVVFYCLGLT